jgi:hypothetical protein
VGTPITLEVIVENAKVSQTIQLPPINGMILNGSGNNPQPHSDHFPSS